MTLMNHANDMLENDTASKDNDSSEMFQELFEKRIMATQEYWDELGDNGIVEISDPEKLKRIESANQQEGAKA